MTEWLHAVDDEVGRGVTALIAAVAAFIVALERAVVIRRLRYLVDRAQVRHVEWFAEAIGADPCDVLRLHPTMRRFCEDGERVEAQRSTQLLEIVDVDLPAAS